jgi:hypothetical protein
MERLACVMAMGLAACGPEKPEEVGWSVAFDATEVGWLLNVWGPSPDNLYAAGGGLDAGGVVMHFDGATWSQTDVGVDVPLLNWSHGFGPSDITVVGNGGTVLHYDGAAWELQATPTTQDLWGVWGASPADLWAVGGTGRPDNGEPVILHYDGSAWEKREVTLERPQVYAFFKVWGSGASDVIVVGQRGALLRFDGTAWEEISVGASVDLISVWGTGPDRVVVVGGRGNGAAVTWDGATWRHELLTPLPGLNGVWMGNPEVAHVVGINGTIATLDFDTLAYEEAFPDTFLTLHSIFGDGERLTAVGGSLSRPSPPYEGVAYSRPNRRLIGALATVSPEGARDAQMYPFSLAKVSVKRAAVLNAFRAFFSKKDSMMPPTPKTFTSMVPRANRSMRPSPRASAQI